jgi:2-aminoethylphosphonate-pyruvate transaminase
VLRLAKLCEVHGVQLLLDAVSSFGAEAIPFESPALVACAATANKCLHGIPGLCFVVARRPALAGAAQPPRSLYLDLSLWLDKQDQDSTPFTPPVNALLALDKALEELRDHGGWQARHARYTKLAGRVRRALAARGVEALLPGGASSCVLVAYQIPEGSTYAAIHDRLKQWGFVIYAGQGSLAAQLFRISTMGDITDYDMERLLAAIESVFQ